MPAGDDIALDEKRVFEETREETVAWVASPMGVTRVSVAGTRIGRFTLARACDARDLAAADGRLYVATTEDVLVGTASGFEPSGFGPADAVGMADGRPLAARRDGTIAALEGNDWGEVGTVPSDVRRMDGTIVAAADGIYHVAGDVSHAGLDDARDVADAAGGAYAATAGGVYHRKDGWNEVLSGEATVVAAGAGQAHAVVEGALRARHETHTWPPVDLPVDEEEVVDVSYGERTMAVTTEGTMLVAATDSETDDDGWRHRALGIADVAALAVA